MEGDLAPDPRSVRRMFYFDALPAECRAYLASYPRAVPAEWALDNWRICSPDLAEWRESVRLGFPCRD